MKIIDGKKVSIEILDEIKSSVDIRVSNNLKVPHLAAVLVGDDGPSQTYVNSKIKACERVGFESSLFKFQKSISEVDLINEIEKINRNNNIDGFIVQLPLPDGINQENILSKVDPSKDVDGFHPVNYGKMALGIETFLPATPAGIIELISRCKIDLKSKKCLVIGRSQIVGRPISILLSQNKIFGNATVTVAHSRTTNLKELCINSDIIISAIGIPQFIKGNMIKKGVTIIDVGISRIDDKSSSKGYKIVGDVDFENVSSKVGFITPVPGGVGPMTIAMLLKNTLKSCSQTD
ncbi:MAG: bifunctional 5,10-methylenetetrahydrofolate dehydrogenase/5,10-methenyltetrahydrofolate cyclohydrolase [Flavobacteriales bacterium]|nr:MAG: bifunctional 5,10-methylenetetrahydrofolate dehydrogenase/5,10-methenyltetrahydrofolate cyclohydrolase [Flavobacteriales bacterium]CAI8338185.1 MAG: Bifunctional protein FolD protein [Flavobacteriales bacterium]|tara:strand:+ start:1616 stop:2491 length:876 start_codon:yes stop_codon:yes gene_type:complete